MKTMAKDSRKPGRPALAYLLMATLIFLAFGGAYGGQSFISDPTGAGLGMSLKYIQNQPFVRDYTIPGWFLLIVMCLIPAFLVVALWRKTDWAWPATLGMGIVVLGWMVFQITIMGLIAPIQYVILAVGVILVVVSLLPPVRRYYQQ